MSPGRISKARAKPADRSIASAPVARRKGSKPPVVGVAPPSDPHFVAGTSRATSPGRSAAVRTRASQIAKLPAAFTWYESPLGLSAPDFLRKKAGDAHELFFDFSVDRSTEGEWGSGVHLGGGLVLTAFHVVYAILRNGELQGDQPFVGDGAKDWFQRWQVKMLPARGCYGIDGANGIDPQAQAGTFNDFAIVKAPEARGRRAIQGIRATKDLAPGEALWVIGDKTGGKIRVDAGSLAPDQTDAIPGTAILNSSDLEAGFSGSPVLDTHGNLVGVTFGTDDRTSMMVRSETMVDLIQQARRANGDAPLKTIGF